MSLSNSKAALFGKGQSGSNSTAPASSRTGTTTSSTTASSNAAAFAAVRAKRTAEAEEFREKAEGYLKTNFFQWKPDHVAAAPMFERAADLFKQAENHEMAYAMMLKAAQSHESYNAFASVAVAYTKAAAFLKAVGPGKEARMSELLSQAAEFWGLSGDIQKYGEALSKAAKELEDANTKQAQELYKKSISVLCPDGQASSPMVPDILRSYFSFLVRRRLLDDAIALAGDMVRIFLQLELPTNAYKALAAVTVLQLAQGDSVKAQQTYLQEHMNVPGYLQSRECALADDLTLAYSANDIDKLDTAKRSPEMRYLDFEVQQLGQQLSLFGPAVSLATPVAATATAAASGSTVPATVASAAPRSSAGPSGPPSANAEASKSSLFAKPSAKAPAAAAPSSSAAAQAGYLPPQPPQQPQPADVQPPPPVHDKQGEGEGEDSQQLGDALDGLEIGAEEEGEEEEEEEEEEDPITSQRGFGRLSGEVAQTSLSAPSEGMLAHLSQETTEALLNQQQQQQQQDEDDEIDLS